MSPLALELVRRMSWLALLSAVILLAVPRLTTELGLWGPSAADEVDSAERALKAAREYGATENDPAFYAARIEITRARQLVERGEQRRARQVARRALPQAIEAQRAALTERETARRQAAAVATDIDRRLNDLEGVYSEVSAGADKATASTLVSIMKDARRKGATVLLSIEEGEYREAVEQHAATLEALDATRERLESYRR